MSFVGPTPEAVQYSGVGPSSMVINLLDMKDADSFQSSASQRAYAALYQLLAVAWAYPTQNLFDALQCGELQKVITQALYDLNQAELPQRELITRSQQSLDSGILDYLRTHDKVDLETDYVALFENNFDAPVTHLYQHLYVSGQRTQIEVLKSLNQRYQRLGIGLKQGEGVEQADHLSVQLECLAFLYMRLAQNIDNKMKAETAFYLEEVRQFSDELSWINVLAEKLQSSINHLIYLPLIEFTRAVLVTAK